MKKRYWLILGFILAVLMTYFLDPPTKGPSFPKDLPVLPADLAALENHVEKFEEKNPVRADNQARILWQHNTPQVTEYSIVYLHGFSGSYRDGYPVNVQIADSLGANIYLSRLAGHGLRPPASLSAFSPRAVWESAKEALVIGKTIGEKVIIISTSTGGTLALKLAATYPEDVFALINLSPNIKDEFNAAFVLNSPWGYQIAQAFLGDNRKIKHQTEIAHQYWDTLYPSSALVELEVLVGSTMKEETFKQVKCPVLTLYYYENFFQEDGHVEVEVYPKIHRLFSTPDSMKSLVKLKTPKTHFIGSDIKSRDTGIVVKEILEFLRKKVKIQLNDRMDLACN